MATPNNTIAIVDEFSDTNTDSDNDDINLEIQRMSRDADMLLDSIREEANKEYTTLVTTRSIDFSREHSSSSSNSSNNSSSERFESNIPNLVDDDADNIKGLRVPIESGASIIKDKKLEQTHKKHRVEKQNVDDDDDDNDDDEEDDDMINELKRLESVAAEIREYLDNQNDNMEMISSPLILRSMAIDDDDSLLIPTSIPQLNTKSTADHVPKSLDVEFKSSTTENVVVQSSTTVDSTNYTESNKINEISQELAELIIKILMDTKLVVGTNQNDIFTRSERILRIVVAVVWAIVFLLLMHANYYLIDDTDGTIRLPFHFLKM